MPPVPHATSARTPKLKVEARVPLFVLPSTEGRPLGPGAMRSRYNLVLVFLDASEGGRGYLRQLAALHGSMLNEQARLLVVVRTTLAEATRLKHEMDMPFTLLADETGETTRRMLGEGAGAALCVADRFGELYSVETAPTPGELPSVQLALDWLFFIMVQCPE